MIFVVLIPFVIAIAFYLYFFLKRICETFNIKTNNRWIKSAVIIASVCLAAGTMMITGFFAIIILHIIFVALLIQLINFIIKKLAGNKYSEKFYVWQKIYGSGIVPIFLTAGIMIFGYWNLNHVVETNYTVYTNKDIRAEGYRVALIADVHFGVSLDYEELLAKCDEISQKDADIVVLCGDIVDNSTSAEDMKAVFDALGKIQNEYGIFYVHGNHDRPMARLKSEYTEEALISTIKDNGITILQDDIFEINDDFVLVGREDRSVERTGTERMDIETLLEDVNYNAFILTLDHQPNQYIENGKAGTDLLLSGHTHGGQFFPLNYVQELIPFNDGVYGYYRIDEDTQAIVTSGFAAWNYPVKTVAPSEYVIIDIKSK